MQRPEVMNSSRCLTYIKDNQKPMPPAHWQILPNHKPKISKHLRNEMAGLDEYTAN